MDENAFADCERKQVAKGKYRIGLRENVRIDKEDRYL